MLSRDATGFVRIRPAIIITSKITPEMKKVIIKVLMHYKL